VEVSIRPRILTWKKLYKYNTELSERIKNRSFHKKCGGDFEKVSSNEGEKKRKKATD